MSNAERLLKDQLAINRTLGMSIDNMHDDIEMLSQMVNTGIETCSKAIDERDKRIEGLENAMLGSAQIFGELHAVLSSPLPTENKLGATLSLMDTYLESAGLNRFIDEIRLDSLPTKRRQ